MSVVANKTGQRFPHNEFFKIDGKQAHFQDIMKGLLPFLSEERIEKIESVVAQRTYSIVPVLDSIHDVGNINAVVRSAENLGYQALHIIKSEKVKDTNRSMSGVTQGSHKWVDKFHYDSRKKCLQNLKQQGYQICATSLNEKAVTLQDIDFSIPTAMVFGNEKDGVSPEILEEADKCFYIPTSGFSQSFNISVASALCLHHAYLERFKLWGQLGDLNDTEQSLLKALFYLKSVKNYKKILNHQGLLSPL